MIDHNIDQLVCHHKPDSTFILFIISAVTIYTHIYTHSPPTTIQTIALLYNGDSFSKLQNMLTFPYDETGMRKSKDSFCMFLFKRV